MNNFTSSIAIALLVVSGTACKKDKAKDNAKDTATAGAPSAKAQGGAAAKPAGCPAGFTNPGDVGACIKMPEGMKPDTSVRPPGGSKRVSFNGEGGATVDLIVGDASDAFWDDNNKKLGGDFGGTPLAPPTKLGDDGVFGVFTVDGGDRQVSTSRIRNKTSKVDCQAWKDVKSTVGPKLEVMMDVCKSITLP